MLQKIFDTQHAFTALKNGDDKGLAYYFDQYYSSLCYYSNSITGSETTSEDIVSESFLKLWNSRECLKQQSHVKHFLYVVVRNSAVNFLRERKKEKQKENTLIQLMPLSEKNILDKLIETETYKQLYYSYSKLPKKCRKVFEMFYLERKAVKEIAQALSISVNTVKSQKQRALQLLKEYHAEQNLFFIITCLPLVWLL